MIGRDGIGDRLQQHGLAGARRGHDQSALALADGREQVHHAAGEVVLDGFHLQPGLRIKRSQVIEEDLVAGFLGRLKVDGVDFDQRKVTLAFLGRADLAADGVAGAQIEAADLRGRDVDVVGTRQVVVFRRAQKAEAVGQAFEHAFREDQAALLRLHLQDLEDELLFAESGEALDAQIFGDLVELLDAHVLQLHQIESVAAILLALRGGAPAGIEEASGHLRLGGFRWVRLVASGLRFDRLGWVRLVAAVFGVDWRVGLGGRFGVPRGLLAPGPFRSCLPGRLAFRLYRRLSLVARV